LAIKALPAHQRGKHTRWERWQERECLRVRRVRDKENERYQNELSRGTEAAAVSLEDPKAAHPSLVPASGQCYMGHHGAETKIKRLPEAFHCWYSEEIWCTL
jgi:hypothetical protein